MQTTHVFSPFLVGYISVSLLAICMKMIGLLRADWLFTLLPLIVLMSAMLLFHIVKEIVVTFLVIRLAWRTRKSGSHDE